MIFFLFLHRAYVKAGIVLS